MTKRLVEIAGFLATIGAAVLAIASLKELLDHFDGLPYYYKLMAVAGIAAIGAALLLTAIWFLLRVRDSSLKLVMPTYSVGAAQANELDGIYEFCKSVLVGQVASRERFRQWYEKNPTILSVIYRERRSPLKHNREVVGFFSVFPVTKEAKELFSKNQLKGTELTPRHIVSPGHRPTAIYIGAVGARGFRAKEQTLGSLMGYVASLAYKTPLVYTRPVSKDGMRLVKQHGFDPVSTSYSGQEDMVFVRQLNMHPSSPATPREGS